MLLDALYACILVILRVCATFGEHTLQRHETRNLVTRLQLRVTDRSSELERFFEE